MRWRASPTAEEDWHALVRILERQIPLAEEPGRAVELGLQRAQIFDEKLHDTDAGGARRWSS